MPVAVNLYKIRQAKDAGGELFRSVQRQKDQYQGLWIVSPDGIALASHQNYKSEKTWTHEVLDTLATGLKAFGPVTPRQARTVDSLPYRGTGVQPNGSVCLALYTRYVRGGGHRLAPAALNNGSRWMWEGDLKPDGPPVIDTLPLTAGEWVSFAPVKAVVGTEWAVPEAIARKFSRALSPSSDQSTMPRPEEATVAELKARVESVQAGQARIRLAGRWEMKHLYDGKASYAWATAEGVASCDMTRKAIRSLLLVFSGAYRMVPPYDKEDRPTGAVVEWRSEAPANIGLVLPEGYSPRLTKLRVSSNHRYLEDASGRPFFLVGDCPQNLSLKLTIAEFDTYMAECRTRGFNWLWICMDGQRSGSPPAKPPVDRQGNPMMRSGWDIGTLNDAYFATIDAIVMSAQKHYHYCAFTPLSECQWSQDDINKNTAEKWREYGSYLGKRYKNEANIIWVIGNDNINTTAQHAIIRGIKDVVDTHLMTVNWRPGYHHEGSGWVRKHQHGESWIDLNAWYINAPISENGAPCYWQKIEYERPNPMPSFQCEAAYQSPDHAKATDLACRMQNYYVALGGGCGGQVYGAGWLADEWDYNSYKNNGGRLQTIHFKNLFVSRDWTSLVPDYQHSFITAGYGTLSVNTMDYVGAAINSGTLGMAYFPKSATITADMSKFSSPVMARWYDPTNGKFQDVAGSPFPNSGSRSFTTPGKNSAGDGDWVLVLEARTR